MLTCSPLSTVGRTEQIDVNGVAATLIEIAGATPEQSQLSPPMVGGGSVAGASSSSSSSNEPPSFTAPEQWESGGSTSMSLASYQVDEDGETVRITVTPLPPSDLLANVNRWRSQIALDAIGREQLDDMVSKIELGEIEGDYVALEAPQQTILGVIAVHNDLAWFIKLMGDSSLAKREQGRFEDFVRSFRFN